MKNKQVLILLMNSLFSVLVFSQQPLKLTEQKIQLEGNISFVLKIPVSYKISVAAEGLSRPRFFAKSPDGRLFVTDMFDRTDNKKGKIYILEDWNEKTKQFNNVITYLQNLHNPNQVAFYSANGQQYIYVAETGKLSYYKYTAGDNKPSSQATVIAAFPDYGLSYKYGGWHLTRSIAFHNNKIYVSVGSSCDACIEKEVIRASIVEMDSDGGNQNFLQEGCEMRSVCNG